MRSSVAALWLVVPLRDALGKCPAGQVPWPGPPATCEPLAAAQQGALAFLRANAPPWDLLNEYTLFGAPGGVDGLEFGVASVGAPPASSPPKKRKKKEE